MLLTAALIPVNSNTQVRVLPELLGRSIHPIIDGVLQKAFGLDELFRIYEDIRTSGQNLFDELLRELRVTTVIAPADLRHIPVHGATVIVANHPFGLLDGAVLASAVRKVRSDVKFLANDVLGVIAELREQIIPVDVLKGRRNARGIRAALQHLRRGGALVIFPAGEVARGRDSDWNPAVSRFIALGGQLTVIPAHVSGTNSVSFRVASALHARLGTAMLARELLNKRGRTVEVRFGRGLSGARLSEFGTHEERVAYLRWRTDLLGLRQRYKARTLARVFGKDAAARPDAPVATPVPACHMRPEVDALTPLCSAGAMSVFIASASQIPAILREIGRLREIAFRAAGEGTGRPLDLDMFDRNYLHLFVWNHERGEVAGGYRLAATDAAGGPDGLYTATLFRYGREFLGKLGPAIELGRSFVRVEYQRSFSPLLLLWKGICRYVQQNPRYKVLFGPVSISNTYSAVSRELIVSFLEQRTFLRDLAGLVSARNPLRRRQRSRAVPGNPDDLSDAVADLESAGPGIPVLLRQYLKLGGKLVGFNVDPAFRNVLDGLIVVDLTSTDRKILDRYFGRAEAERFLSFHRGKYGANTNDRDSELDAARDRGGHPLTDPFFQIQRRA